MEVDLKAKEMKVRKAVNHDDPKNGLKKSNGHFEPSHTTNGKILMTGDCNKIEKNSKIRDQVSEISLVAPNIND